MTAVVLWRFMSRKPLTDRRRGKILKLFRQAPVIEQMATRAEDLIELVQAQSVGVG